MSPRIVAIREDTDVGDLSGKKRLQPTYAVGRGKCIFPVAIQTMNRDNTVKQRSLARVTSFNPRDHCILYFGCVAVIECFQPVRSPVGRVGSVSVLDLVAVSTSMQMAPNKG